MGAGFEPCALCLLVGPSRFACRFRPRPLGSVAAFGDEWEPPHPLAEGNHPPGAHLVPYPSARSRQKPPTSRAIHTAGDTTRTVSAFPAAPYVFTRGHANLLGARFPHHHSRKAGIRGQGLPDPPIARGLHTRRCVKLTTAAPCTYGAVSNPASLGRAARLVTRGCARYVCDV